MGHTQAIDSLDQAIQRVPENGGLHEQRAILLMHLVTIMKKQCEGSPYIRAKESEEIRDYTRALELLPKEDSPLWGPYMRRLIWATAKVPSI
jgi:hypothetical protein